MPVWFCIFQSKNHNPHINYQAARTFTSTFGMFSSASKRAVERHYDAVPQQTKRQRLESPTLRLRNANNAVKGKLYDSYGPPVNGLHVEFACGKGGDLFKVKKRLGPGGRLVAFDISSECIEEAGRRLREAGTAEMPSCFYFRYSMTSPVLWRTMDLIMDKDKVVPGTIDSISCHFALHYAWDTETNAKMVFINAAARLRKNGLFACTIVDWPTLVRRMTGRKCVANALYSIEMPETSLVPETDAFVPRPYTFSLVDAVNDCQEYGIPHGQLCRIANDAGFSVFRKAMLFADDMLDAKEATWRSMTTAEQEVCSLYAAWVFIRR